jgi:hypothetical protein
MPDTSSELARGVKLPKKAICDLRGASGPWIDYFCASYPDWAKICDPSRAEPVPWPVGFDPDRTPIFAHNEITIAAPPARVFRALLDARSWPSYYENASQIELPSGETELAPGARFRFTTFGVAFDAAVTLFETNRALGWTCFGGTPEISVHHRWLLAPIVSGGEGEQTRLVTEETNFIASFHWLSPLCRWLNEQLAASGTRQALPAAHQRWLSELRRVIEAAPSPARELRPKRP